MTTTQDLRFRAAALRSVTEREADAIDRACTLTPPMIDAITDAGLWHIAVPHELGGHEADTGVVLDVCEELSFQDGSVGWSFMANVAATAYTAYLNPRVAEEMVAGRPASVLAGQLAPKTIIRRKDDGFIVGGDFSFGSGSAHASYLSGGGMVEDHDGKHVLLESGSPAFLGYFVPAATAELKGGWDVMGLRGTGSFDYTIPERFIDADATFWVLDPVVHASAPLYRIGPICLAGIGHAGWGLGVARRALHEIEQIAAGGRYRLNGRALSEHQYFQREIAKQSLALDSARLLVHDVFGKTVDTMSQGQPMTPDRVQTIMASVTYMTEVCGQIVQFAYAESGSQGLRNPSILQRCFRDFHTGAQHIFVDHKSYEALGTHRLDAARAHISQSSP
ncbi:acyl-CoA dehydrogenase family protein [Mycobacterium sp.]|uniref:acyl-CoA dehydrogenase family protein n=1 Tax=Mycobacterium sp. TaxID=1785 RepID=UPI003BACE3F5